MTKNKKVVKTAKNKQKERVVPFKNYLVLLFICLATLGIVSFASIAYRRMESKKFETPVISGVIAELKKEDLDNYIVENDSFFLYIGAASDYNSREVFNKKYVVNDYSKLESYPAFIIINDGKVLDLVQRKETRKLNIGDIDRVLDEYGY